MKAIRATHGWIITFGFNYGIGAAVGAAVHEGPVIRVQDDSEWISYIQCLGITPWLCVKNRDELKNPELSVYEFVSLICFADLMKTILTLISVNQ